MNIYDKRLQSLSLSTMLTVARIDELKGGWNMSANLASNNLKDLKRSTLIASTGASTRIEGSQMNDQQINSYLKDFKIRQFATKDIQEVKGYYEVLELIFNDYDDINFSEDSIKYLHGKLLQYCTEDDQHRGNYKHMDNTVKMLDKAGQVLVTVVETTPADLTSREMQGLVDWYHHAIAENKYHPLLILANFIVSFLKIHPFMDGNGRLSRLLTNYFLLSYGYKYIPFVSHESLIETTKGDYYRALQGSQKTFGTKEESIEDWTVYFLNILLRQASQALDLLKDVYFEKNLSPKQIAVWLYLGTVDEASPSQISQATDVNQITVSQVINKLISLRKVERLGQGRATRYRRLGN